MQEKTDLYLCGSVQSNHLKFLQIFDRSFSFSSDKTYFGFLGVKVDRIKMVSIVLELRKHHIECFSVPLRYRDEKNIPHNSALEYAKEYAQTISASVLDAPQYQSRCSPLFWMFGLRHEGVNEEKTGGVVMIDRLDGHVWSQSDYEEYMYDYNNIL